MNTKIKDHALFVSGILICFILAAFSVFLENLIPGGLLGASIIALFSGTLINSFFHPDWIKPALKFVSKKVLMVSALAAIGLGTSITDFKKAGLAPMFYGITIDTLVTLTALAVIFFMGLM